LISELKSGFFEAENDESAKFFALTFWPRDRATSQTLAAASTRAAISKTLRIACMLYQIYLPRHQKETCEMTFRIRLIFLLAIIAMLGANTLAQTGGGSTSGGAVTPPVSPRRSTTTPSSRTTSVGTSAKITRPATTTAASIEGKWWTSGNGFGDSEVILTQAGANVSGVINYADGRTGTIKGTMVGKRLQMTWTNSNGDGGSGWLELSWNNFLGGPWRSATVRDGSWTMMRVEGKWCFGGSRSRIRTVTHDARGRLSLIDEYNEPSGGYLAGPWIYLEDEGMRVKGEMDFRSNRVLWENGLFWTWCGRN
jgi:hypothetical protein